MNIKSDKVYVFPSVRRAAKYPKSRLTSEQSYTGFVSKIVDNPSYVCSYDSTTGYITDTVPLRFVVGGYYFEISQPLTTLELSSKSDTQYAHIVILSTGSDDNSYKEIFGQDDNGKYTGLVIDENPTINVSDVVQNAAGQVLNLKLLEKSNTSWIIPRESLFKFNSSSFEISIIDGGEIE